MVGCRYLPILTLASALRQRGYVSVVTNISSLLMTACEQLIYSNSISMVSVPISPDAEQPCRSALTLCISHVTVT
jgi:hypothetical protein